MHLVPLVRMLPSCIKLSTTDEHEATAAYGFLSMPFFLFTLPVLQRVLTHVLPTAYDFKGRCRKPIPPQRTKQRAKAEELVSEAEVEDLFTKIKALLTFSTS